MQEDHPIEEYVVLNDLEEQSQSGSWIKIVDFLTGKYFVPLAFILVSIIAFTLGRISASQDKREPVRVINNSLLPTNSGEVKGATSPPSSLLSTSPNLGEGSSASAEASGKVVGSKNGTKYHYPWCAGAKQISAKNLITFNSIEEARAKGYTPASNCKGLK